MREKGNKCPFCSKKMVLINNRYKCEKCGYTIVDKIPNMDENKGAGGYSTNSNFSGYGNGINTDMFSYEQDHKAPRKGGTGNVGVKIFVGVAAGLVVIVGIGLSISTVGSWTKLMVSNLKKDYETERTPSAWDKDEYEKEVQESYLPQSELFKQFASAVFQKDYTEVTKEEYASITSFRLGNDYEVYYSIGDGEETVVYLGEYYSGDMTDLNCFSGLKKLDLTNASYIAREDYFKALTNLEEIAMEESPSTIALMIPNKERIRSIKIGDDFLIESLEGIEKFTGLEELYIGAERIASIEELSGLEQLKVLVIEDGEQISNFGSLASLKNLTKLSITSSGLKNIEFIKEMKQLEDVTICESSIKDIEILKEHKDTLKQLTLLENYNITDYSVVDEFTNLEAAAIEFTYDTILPTFAGMTNLTTLSIEGAEDISFLGNAVNVTELTLADCYLDNIEVLTALSNLKALHINEAGSYTKNLSPVMKLTSLELLDISGTNIFGYVEELLSLPNLKEFYMDECVAAFDFNKITGNENLKIVSMNEVKLLDYGPNYDPQKYYANGEGTQINISDYADAFQKFPNLTELYLASDEIENVEFAKGLPLLEVLDISDNYVSSVAPLKELSSLNVLWCEDNDIIDLSELGSGVTIVEE